MTASLPPRFRAGDALQARAHDLADHGHSQEEIAAALEAAFPGMPNGRYYHNPAAIAAMDRMRREQKERERAAANSEWRRQRGLPVSPRQPPFLGEDVY